MESESSSLMACEPYIGSSLAETPVNQEIMILYEVNNFILLS